MTTTSKTSATKTTPRDVLEGTVVIFLEPIAAFDRVQERGSEVVLTLPLIESTVDRLNRSWLDMIDRPEEQIAVWGVHTFTRDADLRPEHSWRWGDPEWQEQRALAHRLAVSHPEGSPEREAALREVQAVYGPPPEGVTMMAKYSEDRQDRYGHR